jgi:hypothetical protein
MSERKYPLSIQHRNTGIIDLRTVLMIKVIWDGSIKAIFKAANRDLKIERLEIVSDEHTELLPRKVAKQTLTPPLSNRSTSPETKRSPMERTGLNQMNNDGRIVISDQSEERSAPLPESVVNDMGVTEHIMRYLEVPLAMTVTDSRLPRCVCIYVH